MTSTRNTLVARLMAWVTVLFALFSLDRAFAERMEAGPLVAGADGRIELALTHWPRGDRLDLPWDGAPLSAVTLSTSPQQFISSWELRPSEQTLRLILKRADGSSRPAVLALEPLTKSRQFPDGRYVFSVAESHTQKVPGSDRAFAWDFEVSRPGNYSVEVTGQAGDFLGQPVEVHVGEANAVGMLEDTGRRSRVVNTSIGRLRLTKPGTQHLLLTLGEGRGEARRATVQAVTLRPAPEGEEPIQESDNTISLRARSATLHSVKAQYHPEPQVDAIAFWTEPTDWVSWNFSLLRPGRFNIEMVEGCANGQGGSEVLVSVGGRELRCTVPETGGWQKFESRLMGEIELPNAGEFQLVVKPVRKAGDAIMDLREIRLVPQSDLATAKRLGL